MKANVSSALSTSILACSGQFRYPRTVTAFSSQSWDTDASLYHFPRSFLGLFWGMCYVDSVFSCGVLVAGKVRVCPFLPLLYIQDQSLQTAKKKGDVLWHLRCTDQQSRAGGSILSTFVLVVIPNWSLAHLYFGRYKVWVLKVKPH